MSAIPNLPESLHAVHESASDVVKEMFQQQDQAAHVEHATGVNGVNGAVHNKSSTEFKIHDTVIENFRKIKVIVVGAGYSGIYCGIRIPERIKNCDLVIYDKNAGVGGTWYENRYPGCACDIPSHSYQFSFNPNPNWSSLYAPAAEIQAYLEGTAKKYSVDRFVKLQHEIVDCTFDESESKWHVKVKKADGTIFEDTSDILISARGNLNNIAWPDIEGLRSFQGEIMHSASWNQDYDFTEKRVGIIGSGSSAIQIIPKLQKTPGTQLNCFIRSRTWISPPFGQAIQDELGMTSFNFTDEQRREFADDPKKLFDFRMKIEAGGNDIHALTIKGTEMQLGAQHEFEEGMKARLVKKPEIYDHIKPTFAPGCRRLTPGPGFLEALSEDNVNFIRDRIERVEPKGVVTEDGKLHEVDVLCCATGFQVSTAPPFPVTGLHGTTLEHHWRNRATTYLSIATDKVPNHFMMLGPNAAIGTGSLTMMIESVGDYIIKCVRKFQKEDIKTMTVKHGRVRDFTKYIDAYFQGTVFMDDCKSWYRNKDDKITGLWPGSTMHCIEALRSPRWEDYEYEYLPEEDGQERNQLGWLGNGWSINQLEARDLAWYLTPEFQSPPVAPLPEKHALYSVRAFSH